MTEPWLSGIPEAKNPKSSVVQEPELKSRRVTDKRRKKVV